MTRDQTDTLTQEIPLPRAEVPPSGGHTGAFRELLPWSSHSAHSGPVRRIPGPARSPAAGLPVLILAGLAAAFLGWVSAQPFWLSLGAGTSGTVTISSCAHSRCVGSFTAEKFSSDSVRVSSVPEKSRQAGSTVAARMLSDGSGWAYAGRRGALALRWQAGLGIVLICGIAAGAATGIRGLRADGRRRQAVLWALTLGGPLAIFAGSLLAALI